MSNEISNAVNEIANEITESVNAGFKTLGDLIQEALDKGGSSEAAAFEVSINHGPTRIIVSDADAEYNRQILPTDNVNMRKVQTGTAGC